MTTTQDGESATPAQPPAGCSCEWVTPPLSVVPAGDIKVSGRRDPECGLHGDHTAWWASAVAKGQEIADRLAASGRGSNDE